jgi:hypothetical protein
LPILRDDVSDGISHAQVVSAKQQVCRWREYPDKSTVNLILMICNFCGNGSVSIY